MYFFSAKAKVVITANERVVGGVRFPLKENVDEALDGPTRKSVETVLVALRTSTKVDFVDRDVCLDEVKL